MSALQQTDWVVTPAMREWCRRLANPQWCRLVRPKQHSLGASCRGPLSRVDPTWPFVDKLEAAGLIRFEERPAEFDAGKTEWVAVLTDAGIAAIPVKKGGLLP